LASLANAAFAALVLIYLLVALPLIWYVLQSTTLAWEKGMERDEIHQNAGRRQ
jgi:hypothetical protein